MTGDSSQFQTVGNQLIGSENKQTTAGSGSSWVQKAHQVIAASKQSLVNAAPVLDSMDGAVKRVVDAADPFTPVVDSAAAMQNGDFTGVALEGSELATKKFRIVNDIWSWVKNTFSKFRGEGNDAKNVGYGPNDPPVRIQGKWSDVDIKNGLKGRPPKGLGSPDLHHADQMPGSGIHEILPAVHRGNKTIHPNKYNQGVTPKMRQEDKKLHWWYRAREQGADQKFPELIYDNK